MRHGRRRCAGRRPARTRLTVREARRALLREGLDALACIVGRRTSRGRARARGRARPTATRRLRTWPRGPRRLALARASRRAIAPPRARPRVPRRRRRVRASAPPPPRPYHRGRAAVAPRRPRSGGQTLRSAGTGDQAEPHLREAEAGSRVGGDQVARERDLETSADRRGLRSGDDRLRQRLPEREHAARRRGVLLDSVVDGEHPRELAEVGAGHEGLVARPVRTTARTDGSAASSCAACSSPARTSSEIAFTVGSRRS